MKVAVEGCCHGELNNIYAHIASLERKNGYKVDLLLICGDFQAIRNHADLQCMAVPQKYRQLGGFHQYYLGQKTAPILTIVIGGNHEASNYMWELYHGGWLAPNIYFLGFSGCVQVNGLRIAGSSGIYSAGHYHWGHHETVPYDQNSLRSIYHTRQYDVLKLANLSPVDIFLSHDWPNTIEQHGDLQGLLRRKPFFRQETQTGTLGSPPMMELLKKLRPRWWFSAHLHVKFEALYSHDGGKAHARVAENPDEILIDDFEESSVPPSVENPDEIKVDEEEEAEVVPSGKEAPKMHEKARDSPRVASPSENKETRFLALDKCLPRRDFLQVIDVEASKTSPSKGNLPRLTFDPEWLAITRALHPFLCVTKHQVTLPKAEEARALVDKELEWVRENVPGAGSHDISEVQAFSRTAPGPNMSRPIHRPRWYTNLQTESIARLLQIPNKINPAPVSTVSEMVSDMVGKAAATPGGEIVIGDPDLERVSDEVIGYGGEMPGSSADTGSSPVVVVNSGGWSPSRIAE